jgi:hypothetical protein
MACDQLNVIISFTVMLYQESNYLEMLYAHTPIFLVGNL